ncbi:hypothetical protein JYK14_14400 [Siccirubricoccus sp. KC 17139]|uniref:Right-handed parallel beta-helix repeat-containing protein n=1 Tax=Siccirubricoccus soli TaxID=2899147 RepID=A0ABT1D6X3_9PROT|nr:hypothetical protein [Siccirubricoccus soli]MCO6417347.1 hypothetical protein [Siccirubricoccus soli]MCP2683482.1 hypothetical protein [Siccirubricoccus soli]
MRRLALGLALLLATWPAAAEVLRVGPGQRFARPSEAAAQARPGDRVLIAPGQYRDCAAWHTPDLRIEAAGGEVVLQGPVCAGKALFVIAAPRVTIEGLTFRGAAAPAGNGAGIRAEGGELTIRRSRFEGNENGILTAPAPEATLRIEDSVFLGNGALRPGMECAHGVYAGQLGALVILRSRFEATRICHHVKSRALRTEILDSQILDTPAGEASYLVDIPNGGALLLRGSLLRKGPRTGNAGTAVALGFESGRNPPGAMLVEGNRFENLLGRRTSFVTNRLVQPVTLRGNVLTGPVVPLAGAGQVAP